MTVTNYHPQRQINNDCHQLSPIILYAMDEQIQTHYQLMQPPVFDQGTMIIVQ
jgi:hypothetical protein